MQKVIKLTEKGLTNIINEIIAEQTTVSPYPEKKAPEFTPSEQETVKTVYATSEELMRTKMSVELNLKQSLNAMRKLMIMSGVNPETNNIVADIEKVLSKFDSLYGQPKKKEEKEPKI